MKRKKKDDNKKIVRERICELFIQARKQFSQYPGLSKRYMKLAWNLATKYRVPFNSSQKRSFCRKCLKYLVPSINLRIRNTKSQQVYTCLECGYIRRYGYLKEQKEKRKKIKT